MQIIGLDAAVQDKGIGCVCGKYIEETFTLTAVWDGKQPLEAMIAGWMKDSEQTILAIDAPLGWPVAFRKILNHHHAGRPLDIDPELFFKRQTDLDIRQRFKKTVLEISADRIARTAFFTLNRVGQIEKKLNSPIPLLWSIKDLVKEGMIEVYPAATLLANGFSIKGYKKDNQEIRKILYEGLKTKYTFENPNELDLTRVEHHFDALVCCLSCIDFIEGWSLSPQTMDQTIQEEGWIWVKK